MWSNRARMFRQACELIAEDRKRAGRDYSHHRYLVEMVDACARDLLTSLKKIGRTIDVLLG